MKRFALPESGLELRRRAHPHSPVSEVGRRAAVLGREDGSFEMWAYPLKILSDFDMAFEIQGRRIPAAQTVTTVAVRPEATILTFTHAAFTVREIIFVPLDQPAAVILLDVESSVPLRIVASFRPRMQLMWPAESSPPETRVYTDESLFLMTDREGKAAGLVGAPGSELGMSQDGSARFVIDTTKFVRRDDFATFVIAGAPEGGAEAALKRYRELLGSIPKLYSETADYYRRFRQRTLRVITPESSLNDAFEWAKVRMDKAFAENTPEGSGLLAGFRHSGDAQRPGFAWFFGRDACWTTLALNMCGDFEHSRDALRLLKKHQRADGKIMHELSQSAGAVDWAASPYYHASADSTPLYIIAIEDYWRATGDLAFAQEMWESARKAYEFLLATDSDGNGLIENTNVGHGWVEGGKLYPAHEEIYLQGAWIQASLAMARMAEALGDGGLAAACRERAKRATEETERVFWKDSQGIYSFARRQDGTTVDEATIMPAVPMWWNLLEDERGARMLERIASSEIAADWGARLLSERSALYDPLSYHHGGVWPLFTGWASTACYRYRRPLAGYEFLRANARLTFDGALGAHTEFLSGDRYCPAESSCFDQAWSSAMVAAPLVRGLLGLECDARSRRLTFAPQLPADWKRVEIRNVRVGKAELDLALGRRPDMTTLEIIRRGEDSVEMAFLPAFPLDAEVSSVKKDGVPIAFEMVRGREDQTLRVAFPVGGSTRVEIAHTPGTQIAVPSLPVRPGDRTRRLKVLRTSTSGTEYVVDMEGVGGATYSFDLLTPRTVRGITGAEIASRDGSRYRLAVTFPESATARYSRRLVRVEFNA